MSIKILFLSITLCLAGAAYAQTCATQTTFNQNIDPTNHATLQLTYPPNVAAVNIIYSQSTSGLVEISLTGCSTQANDAILNSFKPSLAVTADNVLFTINTPSATTSSPQVGTTGSQQTSPSSRLGVDTHVSLLAVVLACLFTLPKNRISATVLLSILALGFLTPSRADSPITITISIGVPATITTVCDNSNCNAWNPSAAPTTTPTSAPTAPPATSFFNLRVLVLCDDSTTEGCDAAQLAFDSHGMPYDLVLGSSTDLSTALATTGTGKYSGIVSVGKLTGTQATLVTAYQTAFGVKYAVLNSSPSGITGLTAASSTSAAFTVSVGAGAAAYTSSIQSTAAVGNSIRINWADATASVTPVTITDTTNFSPALMVTVGSNAPKVGAVIWNNAGNMQLHYFITQNAKLISTRVFMPLLVNFVAPGGIFIGRRRLTLTLQADDLFLPTFMWDVNTHVTSTTATNRMTGTDMQNLATFYDNLNVQLPRGSDLTVEWPFNGFGVTTATDTLFVAAKNLQSSFFFISHTFTHPCNFDTTGTGAEMSTELQQNIDWTPTLLTGGLDSPYFSRSSMVTPCISGLQNGPVLQAMVEKGIVAIVGDNSVAEYAPAFPYHAWITNTSFNHYAGVFVVPRVSLDIFYDLYSPEQLVDEYKYHYNLNTLTPFEDIMAINVMYGVQNLVAFRQDPFMMHQANGIGYSYNGEQTSMIALWTQRVALQLATYYTLPIITHKMEDIVDIWQQRLDMDNCGASVTVGLSAQKQIVSLSATSTGTCDLTLSGLSLTGQTGVSKVETYGSETTSWVPLSATTPQSYSFVTPIPL